MSRHITAVEKHLIERLQRAESERDHLRRGIAAYRSHVGRVEKNGEYSTHLIRDGQCRVRFWEREDRERQ